MLWSAGRPLTPGEVNEALGNCLAYTTVMTVLARLWKKGLTERTDRGRGFAYLPVLSESELATRRMRETLEGVSDRTSTLAGFVGSLSTSDVAHLRRLLDRLDPS